MKSYKDFPRAMPSLMAPTWFQLRLARETERIWNQQGWSDAVENQGDLFIAFQRSKGTCS